MRQRIHTERYNTQTHMRAPIAYHDQTGKAKHNARNPRLPSFDPCGRAHTLSHRLTHVFVGSQLHTQSPVSHILLFVLWYVPLSLFWFQQFQTILSWSNASCHPCDPDRKVKQRKKERKQNKYKKMLVPHRKNDHKYVPFCLHPCE